MESLDRIVPAVRISGVVGLAHAADNVLEPPAKTERRGECEEYEIATRNEGSWQTPLSDFDSDISGKRGIRHLTQCREVDGMIAAEAPGPFAIQPQHLVPDPGSALEFDPVPLPHRLDALETLERPSEAYCRVLSAAEQNQRAFSHAHRP